MLGRRHGKTLGTKAAGRQIISDILHEEEISGRAER
jgi:hypothetical protein